MNGECERAAGLFLLPFGAWIVVSGQMNVDRQSRDRYAELLRHFAAGRLTNDQYEDATAPLLRSEDLALRELWWAVWQTYDDLHEHRLTGKYKLPPEGRKTVARMVSFLHSDLPYEWPVPPGCSTCC